MLLHIGSVNEFLPTMSVAWCSAWIVAIIGVPFIWGRIWRNKAKNASRYLCSKCGYDISGSVSSDCPECGSTYIQEGLICDFHGRRRSEMIAIITWLASCSILILIGHQYVVTDWKKYSVDRACVVLSGPNSDAYQYVIISLSGSKTTFGEFESVSEVPVDQVVVEFYGAGGSIKQSAVLDAKMLVTQQSIIESIEARQQLLHSNGVGWPLNFEFTQDALQVWLKTESVEASNDDVALEASELHKVVEEIAKYSSFPLPGNESELDMNVDLVSLTSFKELEFVLSRSTIDIGIDSKVQLVFVFVLLVSLLLSALGLLFLRYLWRRSILCFDINFSKDVMA